MHVHDYFEKNIYVVGLRMNDIDNVVYFSDASGQ